MLYDLNIAWSPTTPASEIESTLRLAKGLGYDVVALNHTISDPSIPTQPNPITNPITTPTTSFSKFLPIILRRATLLIADPATTNYRLADFTHTYDLLALRPTSEKSFQWACSSTTEPPALISLDFTQSLGYHIHHKTAMSAIARGSRFEICYSQPLQVSGPETSRQRSNFIGNVQNLLRATKGRGIVLSSEAKNALALRGPMDVVNLLAVWGLGIEKGFEGFGDGARAVVVNEGIRRRGFRGVIDIAKPAEGGEENLKQRQKEDQGNGKKDKKQQQQGQKRKNWGVGGGAEGGAMSKRQAKKLRKEGPTAGKA
ncbi:putative ribonuclease P protein subunit 3 [Podospora fimiseda]|uniref:Ribonuclease P protein subunit 3 n=1 Tax=Podospora fimiseda TaxID=252190 RepID=A0AAN7H2Y0_9PEZI|nr:putative ribonuclease P protein subunit 3 [Podospora fimiseda]